MCQFVLHIEDLTLKRRASIDTSGNMMANYSRRVLSIFIIQLNGQPVKKTDSLDGQIEVH